VALEVLESPERYHPEVINQVIDGLVMGAPATLSPVLAHLEQSPSSPGGQTCAYVLGEVAYKQGVDRDPRILPALLQTLSAILSEGTQATSTLVAAVRECARAAAVPEAEAALEAVLKRAEQEEEPYLWTIENALEVLYLITGDGILSRLRVWLQTLPPNHPLTSAIQEFLAAKRGV
jgi:hypothetical protein